MKRCECNDTHFQITSAIQNIGLKGLIIPDIQTISVCKELSLVCFLKLCVNALYGGRFLLCVVCTVWLCLLTNKAQLDMCIDI